MIVPKPSPATNDGILPVEEIRGENISLKFLKMKFKILSKVITSFQIANDTTASDKKSITD